MNYSQQGPKKIVSLVPSWTETLFDLGFNVVGRTRHCVHPVEQIEKAQVLGGTKDINLDLLYEIDFDLVVADQEENPIDFFNTIRAPILASRVLNVASSLDFLETFAQSLSGPDCLDLQPLARLKGFIESFRSLSTRLHSDRDIRRGGKLHLLDLPIVDWVGALPFDALLGSESVVDKVVYMIWRNPWMSAGKDTYISDGLKHLGWIEDELINSPVRYPVVDLQDFNAHRTLFLFSTEPFPFAKKINDLKRLGLPYGCVVDGESLSWFGMRSFRFLNSVAN